jgi:putative SOS response-associated peptidase YedK
VRNAPDYLEGALDLNEHLVPLKPRYNIAPLQPVALVRLLRDDSDRKLAMLRWGLIPAWVKDPAKYQQPINAKAETVAKKPMFRDAFKRRRCLVLADGFYEWKPKGGRKQPVYIHMKDGESFAVAGLWEHWGGLRSDGVLRDCRGAPVVFFTSCPAINLDFS